MESSHAKLGVGLILALFIGTVLFFAVTPYSICFSQGWSMYDKLPPYNLNVVQDMTHAYPFGLADYTPPELNVGDTVLSYSPITNHLITHDIIAVNGNTYELKGYNNMTNPVPDGWVPKDKILAKVLDYPVLGTPMYLSFAFLLIMMPVMLVLLVISHLHDTFEAEHKSRGKVFYENMMSFALGLVVLTVILQMAIQAMLPLAWSFQELLGMII
jgi:hypothetical protein